MKSKLSPFFFDDDIYVAGKLCYYSPKYCLISSLRRGSAWFWFWSPDTVKAEAAVVDVFSLRSLWLRSSRLRVRAFRMLNLLAEVVVGLGTASLEVLLPCGCGGELLSPSVAVTGELFSFRGLWSTQMSSDRFTPSTVSSTSISALLHSSSSS